MEVTTSYIAASANRHPQAAAVSGSPLLAFGSSNLVALWDIVNEDERGVSETLPGHEGIVTCVKFVTEEAFVSADDKGFLISWRRFGSQWKITSKVRAHEKPVSSLCVLDHCVVTGSSDASVKIWKITHGFNQSDTISEEQTIQLKGRYPLALAITYLPSSKAIVLAVAGTDRNIHIWVRSEQLFVRASVLSGHEDWVKSLDFLVPCSEKQPVILASGSQDTTIRLWSLEPWHKESSLLQKGPTDHLSDELLDAFEASLGDVGEAEEGGRQISLKRHILTVKNEQGRAQQFSITFDALLIGHEAGITSLAWRPIPRESMDHAPTLLSTSTDSSLILWSPSSLVVNPSQDQPTSIWINRQRFGDIGGQRLGGFVGGVWAKEGGDALAWGWAGGWRRWTCTSKGGEEHWTECGAIGGHSGPVKGLDWSPNGSYLLSTGLDQTTRLHGAIPSTDPEKPTWHELGRPQIHGYDLLDAVFIDPLRFVSIADEKVVRVFEAPLGFVELAEALNVAKFPESAHNRPSAASVPPLGLSNKATEQAQSKDVSVQRTTRRPFEGELAAIALWPEIEKIFGHGYESITLTVSPKKRFLATACKATTAEHAVVRVYDTINYHLVSKPLEGHSLTVTRIAFSPDEEFLLSVSRDRSWRLFAAQDGGFVPVAADRSHGRIIWDCAWAAEGDVFATASRDKTAKIWARDDKDGWKEVETIKVPSPATAIAFSPRNQQHRRRLAIGLETGEIHIYSDSPNSTCGWRHDMTLSTRIAHVSQIHRLAWQPVSGSILASCSEDGILKILHVPTPVGG